MGRSTSSSPSSIASSDSDYHDESSDLDELDRRSRRLTRLLRKNINKAQARKSILDVVREKAWLLEDQVKILERRTSDIRNRLASRSMKRKIVVSIVAIASIGSLYYVWKPFDHK